MCASVHFEMTGLEDSSILEQPLHMCVWKFSKSNQIYKWSRSDSVSYSELQWVTVSCKVHAAVIHVILVISLESHVVSMSTHTVLCETRPAQVCLQKHNRASVAETRHEWRRSCDFTSNL